MAEGKTSSFGDPFFVGATARTRELLAVLKDVLPPHRPDCVSLSQVTSEVLFDVAEELKVRLNTPVNGSHPKEVSLDGHWSAQWRSLCQANDVGDGQAAPRCTEEEMDALFEAPLQTIADVVAGLCRTSETVVNALCLTGNGSKLRALQAREADKNVFLRLLPDDKFDRHPLRIFRAENAKLAVARGIHAVFKAESEAREFLWQCADILRLVPYDVGTLNATGKFDVLIKRGTPLPCQYGPQHNPRELTLYKRAYEGEVPTSLGILSFTSIKGELLPPMIHIDEERGISNQYAERITPPPDSNEFSRFRIPLLSELMDGITPPGSLHW